MGNDFVKIQGGTPPPNFTQGVVMDCHPPPETANAFNSILNDFVQ